MSYSGSIIEHKAVICLIQVVLQNIRPYFVFDTAELSYSGSVTEYKAVLCLTLFLIQLNCAVQKCMLHKLFIKVCGI